MKPHAEKLMKRGAAALAAVATLSLAGCGMTTGSPATSAVSLGTISGSVHGGQQPVSGSHVYLLAAGTNGYGGGANSLINNGQGYVTTTSGGGFSITGQYTCPSNSQVYLVALGGNPGLAAGTNNGQLTLLAGLGSCSSLTAGTNITINEVSTAAMAYALSGFMTSYTQVSTSSTNGPGLARAFATIPNLINIASGTAYTTTPGGNGNVPINKIDTLANIIAPCVNSNGGDGSCTNLFSAATVSGQTAPNNTADAMLSIAHNPGNNVTQLYNLSTANAPFQPALTTAPNDFALSINYTGNGLSQPFGIAIDIAGSVFVTNQGNNSVSQFDPFGNATKNFTDASLNNPMGIASDLNGNMYVANQGGNSVTRISNAGLISSLTGGGLNGPVDVAIDGNNAVYVANNTGNSISKFYSNGTSQGSTGFTGGGVMAPTGIAVDGTGQIFTVNSGNNSVSKFNPSTNTYYGTAAGYTGGGLSSPVSVAVDGNSNLFIPNASTSVSEFNNSGMPVVATPYSGGGTGPQGGVAIDGLGLVYVADTNGSIKVLSNSGAAISPSTGFTSTRLTNPTRVRLDLSGNLWVTSNGNSSISEFIGFAAPTTAPLATALSNGTLGKRP